MSAKARASDCTPASMILPRAALESPKSECSRPARARSSLWRRKLRGRTPGRGRCGHVAIPRQRGTHSRQSAQAMPFGTSSQLPRLLPGRCSSERQNHHKSREPVKVPVSPEEPARMVMTSPPKSDWRCTEKVDQDEAQAWQAGGQPDDFVVRQVPACRRQDQKTAGKQLRAVADGVGNARWQLTAATDRAIDAQVPWDRLVSAATAAPRIGIRRRSSTTGTTARFMPSAFHLTACRAPAGSTADLRRLSPASAPRPP